LAKAKMLIVKNKKPTTHYGPQYNIEELGPLSSGEERGFRGGRVLRLVPAEESLRLFWLPLLRERKWRPRRRGVEPAAVSVTRETEIRPAPVRRFRFLLSIQSRDPSVCNPCARRLAFGNSHELQDLLRSLWRSCSSAL